MRELCLGLLLMGCVAMDVAAKPFSQQNSQADRGRFSIAEFKGAPQNNMLPGNPRSRVGNQQAASRAKQRFPDSKILSVKHDPGKSRYRIKLLTNGGIVKYVYVDAKDGEVFE